MRESGKNGGLDGAGTTRDGDGDPYSTYSTC